MSADDDKKPIKIKCTETYDVEALRKLIANPDLDGATKKELQSLKRRLKGGDHIEITYMQKAGPMRKARVGRLYPNSRFCLAEGMTRAVRHTLANEHYWDLDMVASQPTIALSIAAKYGADCQYLEHYVNNRDVWLEKLAKYYGIPKKGDVSAKAFVNAVCFGSGLDAWQAKAECDLNDFVRKDKHAKSIRELRDEMKAFGDMLMEVEPHVPALLREDGKKPWHGNVGACVLQDMERQVLVVSKEFLAAKGRRMDVLIHDGGLVRKLPGEEEFPEETLRELEAFLEDEFPGLVVRWAVKPMDEAIDLSAISLKEDGSKCLIVNDALAAETFLEVAGEDVVYDQGSLYVFVDGMWDKDGTVVRHKVYQHKDKLVFFQETPKGIRVHDYGGMGGKVTAMLEHVNVIRAHSDKGFFVKNGDSGIGKLLFTDGTFDMETHAFKESFDKETVFHARIDRPFPRERDFDLEREVRETLFYRPFLDEERDAGSFLMTGLACALAGRYREKKFYACVGLGNAGRGVLTEAFTHAFGNYVANFNVNELANRDMHVGDAAIANAWVANICNARIAFGNEANTHCQSLNGNLLKSLASGGDIMPIRQQHGREFAVVNRSTVMLMMNDMPKVVPYDDSVEARENVLHFKKKFVVEPDLSNPHQAKADPDLKDRVKGDGAFKNALLWVMADAYRAFLESGRVNSPPAAVLEARREWSAAVSSPIAMLLERCEITKDLDNDFIPAADIKAFFDRLKLGMSAAKFGSLLRLAGLVNDANRKARMPGSDRPVAVWRGIRLKEDENLY